MFEGRDLCAASVAEMREVRGAGIAMIFQEPMTALNPLRTIGDQIAEMFLDPHGLSKAEISDKGAGACSPTFAFPIPRSQRRPIRMSCRAASGNAP
jgi:ABC-type microcin C transport system duplicated ATPase subunit YejF